MTTRRDFFRGAGATMASVMGVPALVRAQGAPGAPVASAMPARRPTGGKGSPATNGYLSSLLPLEDRNELHRINVRMTQLAIQQCGLDGVANQVLFETLICEALLTFAGHGVSPSDLLKLSRDLDVVFPWSLAYGDVRTTFNARFIRFPLAVAFPRSVADVIF